MTFVLLTFYHHFHHFRHCHHFHHCRFRAGHETTAMALTWTLYHLSQQPAMWGKCMSEVDQVLQGQPPTYETLKDLHYIEACLDESLRLIPPVSLIVRESTKEHSLRINGQSTVIPLGTTINLYLMLANTDPDHWEQPMEYQPERFLKANSKRIHPAAWIPFSLGPRSCIGMVSGVGEIWMVPMDAN